MGEKERCLNLQGNLSKSFDTSKPAASLHNCAFTVSSSAWWTRQIANGPVVRVSVKLGEKFLVPTFKNQS